MKNVIINTSQRLFVIPCGNGFTCLGFDVVFEKQTAIARELGRPELEPKENERGTLVAYKAYMQAVEFARVYYQNTGRRLTCELTPQLIGLEGKKVEVVDCYGEKRRFVVGKSTGWMPCHLELESRRESGGVAVSGAPFKSVRVV